ncbi:hypothetical protein BJ912DRAFT_977037 [Pholiota molesta]|nr:hypothetical protein BJ912DRAFT_977037 [Pholiota molesta]
MPPFLPATYHPMSTPIPQDELTSTVCGAVQQLTQHRKANFLLDTALTLIDAGQYGPDVENYFEVYLRTPGIAREDMARALLARGNARKRGGEKLIAKAQEDFQAVLKLDPSNREIQHHLRRKVIHFSNEPASQRAPLEIWERIASYTPRYHLRTWLSISPFHRDIAVRHIFHTVDEYLAFYSGIFKTALPEFKELRDFEWIGYPEMRADMVQAVLASHKHLHGLGLIGWHFDAVGVSAFRNLRKFTLRAEDDDEEHTLRHLILGAYLERQHSWDSAFQSVTIKNLTHLDLVDTRVSHIVFARIAHAHNLQSLTLHGTLEEPGSAAVVFGSDQVLDGKHTFLPHLQSFRFVLVGHDDEHALYHSLLPDLSGLRVLGVRIANINQMAQMHAINLSTVISEKPLVQEYARDFGKFPALSFLHLHCPNKRRPKPNLLTEKDFQVQTQMWISSARSVATAIPSLDSLGGMGSTTSSCAASTAAAAATATARGALSSRSSRHAGAWTDAAWLERKDLGLHRPVPQVEDQF